MLCKDDAIKIQNAINAPYISVQYSTLGGSENASIIITFSLDKRELWDNGILHNSRYAMFHLLSNNKLELFSKQYTLPKFRACQVKSILEVVTRLNNYITTCLNS